MRLINVLDKLGSIEKNSFIKIIDIIISKDPKNKKEIDEILISSDRGLKSVDNQNIAKIFSLTENEFAEHIECEFQEITSQLYIVIDIIIRDGNCILKQDWFSRLYDAEIKQLQTKINKLKVDFENDKSELSELRKRDYNIYKSCLQTAFNNDIGNNRESKITSNEFSIILTLANQLGLSQEEVKLLNYSIVPIQKLDIQEVIKSLKNVGVLFYSNKENSIYVADEMVRILRKIRKKEVAEKFYRRTLKLIREPVINQIARGHNIDRSLTYQNKIEEIIKVGVPFTNLLLNEIYKLEHTLNEKKKTLNDLCEKGLGISSLKGATLDEKINSLIMHFENVERDEKVGISIHGFNKLLLDLKTSFPKLNNQIKEQFQLQDEFVLEANFLLNYNIKPRDILDLINNEDLNKFVKMNKITKRGDSILCILKSYKDVENLFMENYENIASRNLNVLKENGIKLKESELGIKFEELTKEIFKGLGFNVDDKLRKKLNTKLDKMDILLNLGNDDIIIVECKTRKERGYNKFSVTSRQLKSYQKVVIKNSLRISKILLVAPKFSDDFISDSEMDIEMNLSLISASTLLNIFNAFKSAKHVKFPHVLFRDILINEERILNALKK